MDERPSKKRKVRKGTRSCWQCEFVRPTTPPSRDPNIGSDPRIWVSDMADVNMAWPADMSSRQEEKDQV